VAEVSSLRVAVAGVLVGTALAVVVARTDRPAITNRSGHPASTHDPTADFLAGWRRSLTSTYIIDERFERRLTNGRSLTFTIHTVQRPPDRLVTGLGTVAARTESGRLACAATSDGSLKCRRAGTVVPYAQEVAAEMATLGRLVVGSGRLYDVRGAGADCFDLRLRVAYPNPPYGQQATFCFDPASGAPRRSAIRRVQGTDARQTVQVRTSVTPRDLAPLRSG
jgi:hypothetical protein